MHEKHQTNHRFPPHGVGGLETGQWSGGFRFGHKVEHKPKLIGCILFVDVYNETWALTIKMVAV